MSVDPVRIVAPYQRPVGLSASFAEAGQKIGARLGNLDSATAFAMAYQWNPVTVVVLARREEFFVYADACGFPLSQAEEILKVETRRASATGADALLSARGRLDQMIAKRYTAVRLGRVLTGSELASQDLGAETILNDLRWMPYHLVLHFATMSRDRQRGLALAAIALMTEVGGAEQGWPPERAMAAVMPYVEEA